MVFCYNSNRTFLKIYLFIDFDYAGSLLLHGLSLAVASGGYCLVAVSGLLIGVQSSGHRARWLQ